MDLRLNSPQRLAKKNDYGGEMSTATATSVWLPTPEVEAESVAFQFVRKAGFESFDDFYRFSVDKPDEYWALINEYFGVVWDKPYNQFCDLSGGLECPKWFINGELNWVNTVLKWANDAGSADRVAIHAVTESGAAQSATYSQLAVLVRQDYGSLVSVGAIALAC